MNSATARVLSAAVMLPLLILLVWKATPFAFNLVVAAAFVVAVRELRALVSNLAAGLVLVVAYLAFPISLLSVIRIEHGPGALMAMIGVIVVSDTAQYYTGRAFGRRPLAPTISPKKTVEGAIGGAVIATAAGVGLMHLWVPALSPALAAAASLALAVAGMAGDLFESWLKRRVGLKDSGHLIPGHGGILDRIDSWLFAAPVFWAVLRLFA